MGKIKRRKLKSSRYTPILNKNGDTSHNPEANNTNPDKCNSIQNEIYDSHISNMKNKGGLKLIFEKITSNVSEERLTGLNILAAFALEEGSAEYIIKSDIVSRVAPLLLDSNSQVRLSAAGALRNLCVNGSDEMIDASVQYDVLPPLAKLIKQCSNNSPPQKSESTSFVSYSKCIATSMEDCDPDNLIFINASNLLWNLCECSEEAVDICNQEDLTSVILKHIDPFSWDFHVALAAADCLLCISENNPRASSTILPSSDWLVSLVMQSLSNRNNSVSLHFAVTVTGILVNLNYWTPGDSSFRQAFEVLGQVLEEDAFNRLVKTSCSNGEKKSNSREDLQHLISAQLCALEVLSNICCPDAEDDCDENSDDEENSIEELMDVGGEQMESISPICPEILECIKHYHLIENTLKKFNYSQEELDQVTSKGENIIEKFQQLQIRALQCFQNLVACLDVEDFGGADAMYDLWLQLGKMTFIDSGKDDNFLEASSGAMRAIVDKLASVETASFRRVTISREDLKNIIDSGCNSEVAQVRANLSRMVGILGCLLIQKSTEEELLDDRCFSVLSTIVNFLFKMAKEDPRLWVSAEALDVLIDLFSDDKTDKLAAQLHLIENLREIQPQFKAKHNQQRKKLKEHRPLVVTVRDNLVAFIKYKGPRTGAAAFNQTKMATN